MLMMVMLMVGTMAAFSSCSKDDDDDGPAPEPTVSNTITVTNSTGTYTFRNFTFIFLNRDGETISRKECGTVGLNERASASIPTGCTYFYVGFYVGSYIIVSPNYYVDDASTRNIIVTSEMVNSWDAYDASSAPARIRGMME